MEGSVTRMYVKYFIVGKKFQSVLSNNLIKMFYVKIY